MDTALGNVFIHSLRGQEALDDPVFLILSFALVTLFSYLPRLNVEAIFLFPYTQ